MSTLILFLPSRTRLRALGQPALADDAGSGYAYMLTADGQTVSRQGYSSAELLPAAATVIAVPAETDVAWQRVDLPRAGRQMRSALAGLLEENLLDDPDNLHFALEPGRTGGDTAWVAITARAPLLQQLALLEAAQVFVDRIAPLSAPSAQGQAHGHFHALGDAVALRWSDPDGVVTLPLDGTLARQLVPESSQQHAVWTAAPAVAAQAEQWLGSAVTVTSDEQRALAVMASPWNLRQFDLAQRTRGLRTVGHAYRQFMQPQWRPVRIGLLALAAVQVLGLNLLAGRYQQQLQSSKAALTRTLTDTYPQVRAVLDAPLQMQRETELLRASAGRAGDQDLEALLAAAANAWPADRGPADALSFEPGRLSLSAIGWSEAQIAQFRSQLQSSGWQLSNAEGRLTLRRPPEKAASGTPS